MKTKRELIQVIGESTLFGGAQHFLSLVKGLDKKKYNLTCLCPPGPLAAKLKELKGVEVRLIPMWGPFDAKAIKRIRRLIFSVPSSSSRPIVHCHGVRAGWLGRLASIARRQNAPSVIYTEHLWTADYRLSNPILHFLQLIGLWILGLFTDKIIAVSQAVADFLIRHKIISPHKIVVIHNGIEGRAEDRIKKIKKGAPADKKCLVLGFVGSLTKRKGVAFLIKAIADLNKLSNLKIKLIIAGEGPEKRELRKLTQKLGVQEGVEFRGFVESPDEVFKEIDIYVQPSLDEAFGLAVLEALNYGVPVVASCVGGLPELLGAKRIPPDAHKKIIKTEVGYLVPPGNSKALADAILKIVRGKKSIKIGEAAQKRARLFSLEKMIKETEAVYGQV